MVRIFEVPSNSHGCLGAFVEVELVERNGELVGRVVDHGSCERGCASRGFSGQKAVAYAHLPTTGTTPLSWVGRKKRVFWQGEWEEAARVERWETEGVFSHEGRTVLVPSDLTYLVWSKKYFFLPSLTTEQAEKMERDFFAWRWQQGTWENSDPVKWAEEELGRRE